MSKVRAVEICCYLRLRLSGLVTLTLAEPNQGPHSDVGIKVGRVSFVVFAPGMIIFLSVSSVFGSHENRL